jgi:hypothetical protein
MTRKLVINSCTDCPNLHRSGGLGQIAYVPFCKVNGSSKELPYSKTVTGTMIVAVMYETIPEWCPLEVNTHSVDITEIEIKVLERIKQNYLAPRTYGVSEDEGLVLDYIDNEVDHLKGGKR